VYGALRGTTFDGWAMGEERWAMGESRSGDFRHSTFDRRAKREVALARVLPGAGSGRGLQAAMSEPPPVLLLLATGNG